jgi:hypothetical protein
VPPSIKREFCNHILISRKTISFSGSEVDVAKAKGLSLPDHAIVNFCIQCWSINPIVEESDLDKARAREQPNGN